MYACVRVPACMRVRVCVRVPACMSTCPRVHVPACMSSCPRVPASCVYVFMYTCMRACMRACVRACVHACMYLHACLQVHVCVHACVHACTCVYVFMSTYACAWLRACVYQRACLPALHISTGPLARWLFQPFGPVRATRTQDSSGPPGPPIVCSGHTQLRIAGPIKKKSADGAAILFRLPERISAIIKLNFIASSNIMTYSRKTRYPARSAGVVVAWRRHFYFYYKSACFVLGESR